MTHMDRFQEIRTLKNQLNKAEKELMVLKTKCRRVESAGNKGAGGGRVGEFVFLREQRGRNRDAESYVELLQHDNKALRV